MIVRDIEVKVDVEIDLDEFSTEDLKKELNHRDENYVPPHETKFQDLLRHGIEDRDWRKIEEAAELLRIQWFRQKSA